MHALVLTTSSSTLCCICAACMDWAHQYAHLHPRMDSLACPITPPPFCGPPPQGFPDAEGPSSMKKVVESSMYDFHNQYPSLLGVPELRQAVARHSERCQVSARARAGAGGDAPHKCIKPRMGNILISLSSQGTLNAHMMAPDSHMLCRGTHTDGK